MDSALTPASSTATAPLVAIGSAPIQDSDLLCCLEDLLGTGEQSGDVAPSTAAAGGSIVANVQQLFDALRAKDAATAAHCLRTTLGCAIWAERLRLCAEERDAIETAALLHDIGKMAAPTHILRKPARLDVEEKQLLDLCRNVGLEVLQQKVALPTVVEIAALAPTWYDGSRNHLGRSKLNIPFGSRMLAIIDALDSMTTHQPYREALSVEEALGELKRWAGTQFDPNLVEHLCALPKDVLRQWQEMIHRHAGSQPPAETISLASRTSGGPVHDAAALGLFQREVVENLWDGVVCVDRNLRIIYWNRGATRLTGILQEEACRARWTPGFIGMRDGRGVRLAESDCPVKYVLESHKPWFRRVLLRGEDGEPAPVDSQVIPVVAADQTVLGAAILMRDLSPELSLRDRCVSLQQLITQDGLTQVANRTEFDRVHAQSVMNCAQQGLAYSLILCDIDHFKRVNDNYGHQTGDEVLRFFAKLLGHACRAGDLVARYGGEEFAILCPGCDLESAAKRAERMRRELAAVQHPALGGRQVTASFGVTTLQNGDTPARMIHRADKALYQAKDRGRNAVVTVGSADGLRAGSAGAGSLERPLVEQELLSVAPLPIAVEKLRGFVADHHAEIVSVREKQLQIKIDANSTKRSRRLSDRRLICHMTVEMEALEVPSEATASDSRKLSVGTRLRIAIGPLRSRDRRRSNVLAQARDLMACFRSYMMIQPEDMRDSSE